MQSVALPAWLHALIHFLSVFVGTLVAADAIHSPWDKYAAAFLAAIQAAFGINALYQNPPKKPQVPPMVGLLIAALLCSPALAQVPAPGSGGGATGSGSGDVTQSGTNTMTGYTNFSGGTIRLPETTVASLPAAASNTGRIYVVTDAASAGSCSSGGGSARSICRSTGSAWEAIGDGGGGSSAASSVTTSTLAGLPGTCVPGDVRYVTDATATAGGTRLYMCPTNNNWVQMSYVAHGDGSITVACATAFSCTIQVTPSTFAALASANTYSALNDFSGARIRFPEVAFASLPAAASATGQVFVVTDAASAGSCSAGSGSARSLCRSTGSAYESLGGSGGGVSASAPYLLSGSDYWDTRIGIVATRPASSGWTQISAGSPVYSQSNQARTISSTSGSNWGWEVRSKTLDTATFGFRGFGYGNNAGYAILLRRSASTRIAAVTWYVNSSDNKTYLIVSSWDNTSYVGTILSQVVIYSDPSTLLWRLSYSSGTTTISVSTNGGASFQSLASFTDASAGFGGAPDQWGYGGVNLPGQMTLTHFVEQ